MYRQIAVVVGWLQPLYIRSLAALGYWRVWASGTGSHKRHDDLPTDSLDVGPDRAWKIRVDAVDARDRMAGVRARKGMT